MKTTTRSEKFRNYLLLFIFFTLSLLEAKTANATHAAGADIGFCWVGPGQNDYRITYTFYRNCGPNATIEPNTVNLRLISVSCGFTNNAFATLQKAPNPNGLEVSLACGNVLTYCTSPTGPEQGYRKWVYTGLITLPLDCSDWEFIVDVNARNINITTLNNPNGTSLTVRATLNNLYLNNLPTPEHDCSPAFSNPPLAFVCVNQSFTYTHSAIDADGDSLVYTLVSPLQSLANVVQNVNFLPPYTAANPISTAPPGFLVNSVTGAVTLTPTGNGELGVAAFLVEEYRNGVLIGSVMRDMQMKVIVCTNTLPTASGVNGSSVFTDSICPGNQLCFNILGLDADVSDTVTMTWNNGIPAATFVVTGTPLPTGQFCWTPTLADASPTPYTFSVTVQDNACPQNGAQAFTYSITVNPPPVIQTTGDPSICLGQSATLGVSGANTYQWSPGSFLNATTGSSVISTPPATQIYTITGISIEGCTGTSSITVTVNPNPLVVYPANPVLCFGNDTVITITGASYYVWSPLIGITQNNPEYSVVTVAPSATTVYTVTGFSAEGCSGSITFTVTVNPNPVPVVGSNSPICSGSTLNLTSTGGTVYSWTGPNSFSSAVQNPTIVSSTIAASGIYSVVVTDANTCQGTGTVSVTVNANPVPVVGSNSPICAGSTLNLTSSGGTTYGWTGPNSYSSASQNPSITNATVLATGTYSVDVGDANNCHSTGTVNVAVNANPVPVVGSNTPICAGSTLNLTASGGTTYDWTGPNSYLSASQNPSITNATVLATGIYSVDVGDANNCHTTGTVNVTVNPNPVPVVGSNTPICDGSTLNLTASGGTTFAWIGPNSYSSSQQNPSISSATVAATGTYTVDVGDVNNCHTSGTVNIIVNSNPVPIISPMGPTSFCEGGSVLLDGGAYAQYQWNTLAGQTSSSIVVSQTETFDLQVWDNNGCTGVSAPITITVFPNPVPVITPDGPLSFCFGGSVNLDAGAGYVDYTWSNPSSSLQIVNVSTSGTSQVTVTDNNGCIGSTLETVVVNPLPVAVLSPAGPILICSGSPATLSANTGTGYIYQWYLNAVEIAGALSDQYLAATTGVYSVRIIDANGCTDISNDVQVTQGVGPEVTMTASPTVGCLLNTIYIGYGPQSITLTAEAVGAVSYLWSPYGQTTQSISVTQEAEYSVIAYDIYGCPSPNPAVLSPGIQVIDIRCGHNMNKVILCHVPEGNFDNPQTICIGAPAIPPHLALHRWDCLGPCSLYYNRSTIVDAEDFYVFSYPNPFNTAFNLHILTAEYITPVNVELMDVTGRVIARYEEVNEQTEIGNDLGSGVYIAIVSQGTHKQMLQIVKAK